MTEQGYPPRQAGYPGRAGRPRVSQEPRGNGWQMLDAFDDGSPGESDAPPWAVPGGIEPVRPARRPQRSQRPERADEPEGPPQEAGPPGRGRMAGRSRAAQARRRRSKRRLVTWGGAAAAVLALVAGGMYLFGGSPAPKPRFITTMQKGEIQVVPDACKSISAAVLQQYLAGHPTSVQPYNDRAQSQCTFTVDAKPVFRELNINTQAYTPNLTVPVGNGGATAAARYTFGLKRQLLAKPPKGTPQPPAAITPISHLGDQAVSALQKFRVGAVTELVTVLIRYRNVLVSVSLDAQVSNGFGPVTVAQLQSGALAVARDMLAAIEQEPKVS